MPGDGEGISPWPLRDRVEAACDAGFTGFGFWMPDLFAFDDAHDIEELAALLSDRGIVHAQFEMGVVPWWLQGAAGQAVTAWRDRMLRLVERLGVPDSHIKCVPDMAGGSVGLNEYAAGLHDLAAAAEKVGARHGIEFLPFSTISTAREALALVDHADHPNAGIVVDSWHVFRGDADLDFLRTIPAGRLVTIELNDADAKVVGSLAEDTINRRRFCGEGSFPLSEFLAAIDATGYSGAYSIEIISDEARSLTLKDAAVRTFTTTSALFD